MLPFRGRSRETASRCSQPRSPAQIVHDRPRASFHTLLKRAGKPIQAIERPYKNEFSINTHFCHVTVGHEEACLAFTKGKHLSGVVMGSLVTEPGPVSGHSSI